MAIVYRVYSNGGSGGPIDYSTPIATAASPSYTTGPLSASGDYRFGVHAFDGSSGIEELNTQASVRITLDAGGNDVGQAPNAAYATVARPTANGGCLVTWAYPSSGQAPTPTAFLIYLTAGLTPNLATPSATVAYSRSLSGYRCQLTGLADGTTYSVAVVSQAAGGRVSNPVVATVVGDSTPPEDVDALTAVAVA